MRLPSPHPLLVKAFCSDCPPENRVGNGGELPCPGSCGGYRRLSWPNGLVRPQRRVWLIWAHAGPADRAAAAAASRRFCTVTTPIRLTRQRAGSDARTWPKATRPEAQEWRSKCRFAGSGCPLEPVARRCVHIALGWLHQAKAHRRLPERARCRRFFSGRAEWNAPA